MTSAEVDEGVVVRKRVYLDDLDGFGMLNHTRYASLFDQAVLDYWIASGWTPDLSEAVPVVRELTLTFHRPVTSMGTIAIHFWIAATGSTSATYRFKVLSDNLHTLHAEGSRVLVNLSPTTHRPSEFTGEQWQHAVPLLGRGVEPPMANQGGRGC